MAYGRTQIFLCVSRAILSASLQRQVLISVIHRGNSSDGILSVKFSTSVVSIKKNKSNFLCQQVSQVRDGYDTNNISGILRDFSQQTTEITSNENITSGDLGTSVEIITKVAAISAGREDLVTDSDTQVSIYCCCRSNLPSSHLYMYLELQSQLLLNFYIYFVITVLINQNVILFSKGLFAVCE